MIDLRELLTETYCDYGAQHRGRSKCVKDFHIDDRDERDVCDSFCRITVTVPNPESNDFQLTLYPVPWDEDVESLVEHLGGQWQEISTGRLLKIAMNIKSVPDIRRLARAIRRVTGRGKSYVDSNWKWSTRRTADSLDRFARVVSTWNRSGRRMVPEDIPF